MIWLIKQLLHIRNVFKSGDTPRQLAFGVGLGVMLGLVMNGNLLALGLTILVCATRANLSMVALTTLCVGFIAHLADPLTHRIGYAVLTLPALQGTFEQLYQLPLAAWTDFNHTVVMGSFLLGVALVYPTYRATLPFFRRWKRQDTAARKSLEPRTPGNDNTDAHGSNAQEFSSDPSLGQESSVEGEVPPDVDDELTDTAEEGGCPEDPIEIALATDREAIPGESSNQERHCEGAEDISACTLPEPASAHNTLHQVTAETTTSARPEVANANAICETNTQAETDQCPAIPTPHPTDSAADEPLPETLPPPADGIQLGGERFATVVRSRMEKWRSESLTTASDSEPHASTSTTTPDAPSEPMNPSETTSAVPNQASPSIHITGDSEGTPPSVEGGTERSDQASASEPPQINPVTNTDAFREIPKSSYGLQADAD